MISPAIVTTIIAIGSASEAAPVVIVIKYA